MSRTFTHSDDVEQPPAAGNTADHPAEYVIEDPMHPPVDEGRPETKLPADQDRPRDKQMNAPDPEWVKVDVEGGVKDNTEQVSADAEDTRGDNEPIYDLFELGAVEYAEKTKP